MKKIIKNFKNNYDYIKKYYDYLMNQVNKKEYIGNTNELIINNFYLLEDLKIYIKENKRNINNKEIENLYFIIRNIINKYNYNVDVKIIIKELNKVQDKNNYYFSYKELFNIKDILILIYIERLKYICKDSKDKLIIKDNINNMIKTVDKENIELSYFVKSDFDFKNNRYYLYELNNILATIGNKSNKLFKDLNELLESRELSLKEIINSEHKDKLDKNIIVSNIFSNLKELNTFDTDLLINKVSKTEEVLLGDSIYKNMTSKSKDLYRKELLKKVNKSKKTEYRYINDLYESKSDLDTHIGGLLIKDNNSKKTVSIYFISIILISVLVTLLLSLIFNKYRVLYFIVLIVPIYFVVSSLINLLFNKIYKSKYIPRIDYSKGIEKDATTMVVIIDRIDSVERIKELFNKLESLYLINKSKNIYFTLLGDTLESTKEEEDYDLEFVKYGEEYARSLNKKYGKELFYFLYRKRVWNKSHKMYFGYQNKRGALLQFNKILLGKMDDLQESKSFLVNMLHNKDLKIKYVINMESDSSFKLDNYLDLIGAINHPLNKAILNKDNTKVIKGYGIINGRCINNIEYSSRSNYSKLFNKDYSDKYFNIFNEGSYIGNGIYDLEICDLVFDNTVKDDLVVDDRLLNDGYLRCGYLDDVLVYKNHVNSFNNNLVDTYNNINNNIHLFSYLSNKVKNRKGKSVKNQFNIITKSKILNSLLEIVLYLSLFISTLCSAFGLINPFILLINLIIFIILNKSIIRGIIKYISLPVITFNYIYSLIKSISKVISNKDMLSIKEYNFDNKFISYLKLNVFSIIVGLLLVINYFISNNIYSLVFGLIYLFSVLIIYLLDKDKTKLVINESSSTTINNYMNDVWLYFYDNLNNNNNYLMPDNYMEERNVSFSNITTPSSIGYSLLSVVSAYNLGLIKKLDASNLIGKILKSVSLLEKDNGNLYSKYDIYNLSVVDKFVSFKEMGSFISSLIVCKEFLEDGELFSLCEEIISESNFKKFYTDKKLFSVGYNGESGKLSDEVSLLVASEERLYSYIAVAVKNIPKEHLSVLDKSFNNKLLLSLNGSLSEYFIPNIFIKDYPDTLFNKEYKLVVKENKKFVKKIDKSLPWGVSDSYYFEYDSLDNFKYGNHGIKSLKNNNKSIDRVVLSPYSSFLTLKDVIKNIKKYQVLGMYGVYGLYDAYDYSNKSVVKVYSTNHQGMILASFANLLKNNCIKEYFYKDVNIKSYEVLLMNKFNKKFLNIRKCLYKDSKVNNNYIVNNSSICSLTNRKYSLLIDRLGNGVSRYRTILLNKYLKISDNYKGNYLYIKDIDNDLVISNTFAPVNKESDKYEVTFNNNLAKFTRKDNDLITKTEIIVCKSFNAEIRKVTFTNTGEVKKNLELTSYVEVLLGEEIDDIKDRVNNDMKITTIKDEESNALIAKRHGRGEFSLTNYMVSRLVIPDVTEEYSFETDRKSFIGENNTLENPVSINKELSNFIGDEIDPVLAIRNKIELDAGTSKTVYLILGYGRNNTQIEDIINKLSTKKEIEKEFNNSSILNSIVLNNLNIKENDLENYNKLLNYLYKTSNILINEERDNYLRRNNIGLSNLNKFSIDKEIDTFTVNIYNISDLSILMDVIKCYEYFKNNNIFINLVIINNEDNNYYKVIKREIEEEKYRMNTLNSFYNTPGSITLIDGRELLDDERRLIDVISRFKFDIINHKTLSEYVKELESTYNIINNLYDYKKESIITVKNNIELDMDNNIGGFTNNGKDYLIYDNKYNFKNILSNKNITSIVNSNGDSYTYAYNSNNFNINNHEKFIINEEEFRPTKCNNGIGYSILTSERVNLKEQVTEFVAVDAPVKIYIMKLTNKSNDSININLKYMISPILGSYKEYDSRYILSEYMERDNYIKLVNVCNDNYKDVSVFVSSSLKIDKVDINNINNKVIESDFVINPHEEREIVYVLGCGKSLLNNFTSIKKYTDINNSYRELSRVCDKWDNMSNIFVSTPDNSFNYMINYWYLYQSISSRINSYASNNKYIFKERLMDADNFLLINQDYVKDVILENAKHQFIEGDFLHTWDEESMVGERTKYKDESIWLLKTLVDYITVTGDSLILGEKLPYVEANAISLYDTKKEVNYKYSEEEDSLLEHINIILDNIDNTLGEDKLPLVGLGEEEDLYNLVGIKGKGESILLGFILYKTLNDYIKLVKDNKLEIDTTKLEEFNNNLIDNINNIGWDGNYYIRSIFDNKDKLGSHDNSEGRLDLLTQTYGLLTNSLDKDKVNKIIKSIDEELMDKDNNLLRTISVSFHDTLNKPGNIINYHRGFKENGGVNTYSVLNYVNSLKEYDKDDLMYELFMLVNPLNRNIKEYKTSPYFITSNIYTHKDYLGMGEDSFNNPSSSYAYYVGISVILGIRKVGNKLIIKPHIPSNWDKYHVSYKYRETLYEIDVIRNKNNDITMDGISVKDIKLSNDKLTHRVTVNIK